MSQFYGEIRGNRGGASRMGSKDSGLWGHLRGWNVGVEVSVRNVKGVDMVTVYRTGGSNSSGRRELIAEFDDARTGGQATKAVA